MGCYNREMPDSTQPNQADSQREFVSQLAHDLKTPLTVISAYAQMLAKKLDNGEEVTSDLAKKINQMALKMADQITEVANKHR